MNRIAEILVGICCAAAVCADIVWVQYHLFYKLKFFLCRQCADMLRMIALALLIRHCSFLHLMFKLPHRNVIISLEY